jgi:hypothetical protein
MRPFNTIPGQFVGAAVGETGHSEEWDKKYIQGFGNAVAHSHRNGLFVTVICLLGGKMSFCFIFLQ